MVRNFVWFLAGVLALVVIFCGGALIFLKTRMNGFSARAQPTAFQRLLETRTLLRWFPLPGRIST
jgi:hypothetical protein